MRNYSKNSHHDEGVTPLRRQDMAKRQCSPVPSTAPRRARSEAAEQPVRESKAILKKSFFNIAKTHRPYQHPGPTHC